jgi:hypothetical protein
MFSGTTMFVIGAGASCDAGLPVGATLKVDIAKVLYFESVGDAMNRKMRGDNVIQKAFRRFCEIEQLQASEREFYTAAAHISGAMRAAKSIDHFLHSHRNDQFIETCGKLAIARTILQAEGNEIQSKLFVSPKNVLNRLDLGKLDGTWYLPFAELLCSCTLEELPDRLNRIQFIVFNYDRCLEHFLLWAIMIYFNLQQQEAAAYVNLIKIWHPYGKVGQLPWQPGLGLSVPFGSNEYDVVNVAQQLRTFTESVDENDKEVKEMRKALDDANTTIFLGCAYHDLNMRLIQPVGGSRRDNGKEKVFYGTTYGLSKTHREIAENRVRNLTTERPSNPPYMPANIDCVGLFREFYARFDQ